LLGKEKLEGRSPLVVLSFDLGGEARSTIENTLKGAANLAYLRDLDPKERKQALKEAKAVFAWAPHQELTDSEQGLLGHAGLLQLLSAGADHLDFSCLPPSLLVTSNVGAYAIPMAEHALAMVLALAKRLALHHAKLKEGIFDQLSENKTLFGATAAILGFGGIGKALARLLRPLSVKILAINRSGKSDEVADFLGTLSSLELVLKQSDIIVLTLPLNRFTRSLIGKRELGFMKEDAILVNVARGEIIEEAALFEHLKTHPGFMAGIDAWWTEPFKQGRFELKYPFFDLPNVLGTPHNSALVPGSLLRAIQQACENILRFLKGEEIQGVIRREDYEG
jgi:glycerate dehydrogenase